MLNHKAFLFESINGKQFAVVFLLSDDGKVMCRSYGHNAFATEGYAKVFSVNHVTRWLVYQGYRYMKRLPLPQGKTFDEGWETLIRHWVKTEKSQEYV